MLKLEIDKHFKDRQQKIADLVPDISPEMRSNLAEIGINQLCSISSILNQLNVQCKKSSYLSRYNQKIDDFLKVLETDAWILNRSYEDIPNVINDKQLLDQLDNEYRNSMYQLFKDNAVSIINNIKKGV